MKVKWFEEIPNTVFEYYPGDKVFVKTRLFVSDTVIEVYKPGRHEEYGGYSICPVCTLRNISSVVFVNPDSIDMLKACINKAIELLNNEKVGLIDVKRLNRFDNKLPLKEKIEYNVEKPIKVKYIRKSDLRVGGIYREESGRETLFLGNAYLYKYNENSRRFEHINKTSDGVRFNRYIYGSEELIEIIKEAVRYKRYEREGNRLFIRIDKPLTTEHLDSYASLRKWKKAVTTIGVIEGIKCIKLIADNATYKIVIRHISASENMTKLR